MVNETSKQIKNLLNLEYDIRDLEWEIERPSTQSRVVAQMVKEKLNTFYEQRKDIVSRLRDLDVSEKYISFFVKDVRLRDNTSV